MSKVVVCSAAERDFVQALRWYAERSVDAANCFDAAVDRALSAIAAHPVRFPRCDERHRFYLLQDFPFQIVYRVVDREIMVVAIAHTSRDPDYWAKR